MEDNNNFSPYENDTYADTIATCPACTFENEPND